jgi:hypothetical protein
VGAAAVRIFYGLMRLCFVFLLAVCVWASFAVPDLWASLWFVLMGIFCFVGFLEARP